MESFRTELENPVVEKDILDLEKKIFQFKNNKIDEEKFRSLRLARGVYGQRQQGVQMIRIKLPMGKFTAKQLRRIADVSDEYASSNLHITTRQDIQIHYVLLDRTPELWADLEKDGITLREACGNTVRNVTASVMAGIDPNEEFDVTPYANEFFEYFLRNPICQEMGRKFKVAFSSSSSDDAFTFIHDLGFIPRIENGIRGFRVLLGGGIGSQPMDAHEVFGFLTADKIIPYAEAVIRVFDRHGERNKRNKARLKFLIKEIGIDSFKQLVKDEMVVVNHQTYSIEPKERDLKEAGFNGKPKTISSPEFEAWKKTNIFKQKQEGYVSVGLPIKTGDISSDKSRLLADIIELFTKDDNRFSVGQSILLRDVKEEHLSTLYDALEQLDFHRIGFHKINDIVACPGTDTCNLGIASSMGLANELQRLIETEFKSIINTHKIDIKISGCMNACGQHTLAHIGFQGMTLKSNGLIAPATQILLGGGVLGDGTGRFADKLLKVPAKRTPSVLRWILNDFDENKANDEDFFAYYDRQTKDYFYQNLKHYSAVDNLEADDFIDFGTKEKYEKAIGIGECAGVTIDLIQTLIFEAEEAFGWATEALSEKRFGDATYHAYNGRIRAAKALLTSAEAKTNSHASIIETFDSHFPLFKEERSLSFIEGIQEFKNKPSDEEFAISFLKETEETIQWIKNTRNATIK